MTKLERGSLVPLHPPRSSSPLLRLSRRRYQDLAVKVVMLRHEVAVLRRQFGHAQLLQLADDAQVTPPWVLPRQAAAELYRAVCQGGRPGRRWGCRSSAAGRGAGASRVRSVALRGTNGTSHAGLSRRAGPLESSVGPAEPGPPDLAAEHGQLVAQDEDLGVLREGTHPVGPDEPEHPTEALVEERERHGRAARSNASQLVKSYRGVNGPFTVLVLATALHHCLRPRDRAF